MLLPRVSYTEDISNYNPSNIFVSVQLDWTRHMTKYSSAKTGEYLWVALFAKNVWRIINTTASIWLWKYTQIFVLGHYLLLEAHSFPRASLFENCSLLGTDNVHRQISKHIFAPNGGYCLFTWPCRDTKFLSECWKRVRKEILISKRPFKVLFIT